jgi:putative ABC transport system permease protein
MGLYRKIWRTIRESKSQYVGAAVLIALCCLLFSVFNTMGTDVTNNLAFFKTENVQEDAYFILTGELGDAPALERKYDLLLERRGAADFDYADGVTLRVLSETKKVDLHAVVGGEDIQSDHDVLVDPEFAKAHDIKIGVTVELFGEPFTVTGYVCRRTISIR